MSIAVEALAQELHESSRKAGENMVHWNNLSAAYQEIRRNQARELLKRLTVTVKTTIKPPDHEDALLTPAFMLTNPESMSDVDTTESKKDEDLF